MTLQRGRGDLVAAIHRQDGESIAVIGTTTVVNSTGAEPNIKVAPTQLISARLSMPRQWVVTMRQATQNRRPESPWLATFDGSATAPDNSNGAGRNFSAPTMPFAGGGATRDGNMQVLLSWGSGGTRFNTQFDYPLAGKVFGLTADSVELSVGLKTPANPTNYASPTLLPVVGAFMVEGVVTDPVPLRWQEPIVTIAIGGADLWSVKPYARRAHISLATAGNYVVTWLDGAGGTVWEQPIAAGDGRNLLIDVPAQAAVLAMVNGTGALATMQLEWQIGLT